MLKRKKKPRLPPGPTGNEVLDLLWAEQMPLAEALLPFVEVDLAWTSPECALRFAATVMLHNELEAEFQARPGGRIVMRARQRRVALLKRSMTVQTLQVCAALSAEAHSQYPDASFSQTWLVVRDKVRALMNDAVVALLDLSDDDKASLVAASALT